MSFAHLICPFIHTYTNILICRNNCNINFIATCFLPLEVGSCKSRFPRWFYNTTSSQCELFIYSGCHGNKNQFWTLNECINLCGELYITVIFLYDNCPACNYYYYSFKLFIWSTNRFKV